MGRNTFQWTCAFLAFVIALLTGCTTKTQFKALENSLSAATLGSTGAVSSSAPLSGSSCAASQTTIPLKILFMVDNSGSTKDTDPNDRYRYSTIRTFIDSVSSHTNLSYSFAFFNSPSWSSGQVTEYDFSKSAFTTLLAPFTGIGNFFGNYSAFSNALNEFYSKSTTSPYSFRGNGYTPYSSAFDAISKILDGMDSTSKYSVVFLSDGHPSSMVDEGDGIISGDCQNNGACTISLSNLQIKIQNSILSHDPAGDRLTLSGVYFGPSSDGMLTTDGQTIQSSQVIQNLALWGKGQFVDTNIDPTFKINDVITVGGCSTPQ